MKEIVETIVFDAVIGNSDRHQENWAFITENYWPSEIYREFDHIFLRIRSPKLMAPIYDNGSSLGRELNEEKVALLLNNVMQLERYIDKGTSEIHWEDAKISHMSQGRYIKEVIE